MTATTRLSLALFLGSLLVLTWGSNYSVLKAVMAEIGPQAMIFARYLVTPACAAVLLVWHFGLRWPRLSARDWRSLVGLALVGHVVHVTVMTHAMHLSTAFSSALISACGPVFTLLIVRLLYRERFARVQVFGVLLALAGVLVFLSDKLAVARTQGLGDLMLLAGAVLFSAHTVAAGPSIARHGVLVVMAYCTFLAAVPLVVINAPWALAVAWTDLSGSLWLALLWSLAVASFAGWLVWGWLNEHLGVPRSAPLLYLLPPVAGVISWLALGESFGALKIAGALMAAAGVAATQFGPALLARWNAQSV
jgi:drug/metabolite transporter (DMT)-like permease